ncbi:MAG: MazG family protein [Candidatus Nanopelagicales bacterium]
MTLESQSPLTELVAVMARLRRECAWDARQTHRSLVEYLLEETHETIEAIETDDSVALREELGDLLLQVVFHARIAAEAEGWDIDDVAAGIVAKLVRRHPHVFGADSEYADLAEVGTRDESTLNRNWAAIKRAEKSRDSVLDGIPAGLPALAWAQKSWRRAGEAGLAEVSPAPDSPAGAPPTDPDELADQLLTLVVAAEANGWDAEAALRDRVRRLHADVRARESGG